VENPCRVRVPAESLPFVPCLAKAKGASGSASGVGHHERRWLQYEGEACDPR